MVWILSGVAAIGVILVMGASLRAYNDSGPTPCVWEYEEDTTLTVPFRNHPMASRYYNAFRDGRDEWDASYTSAEFDLDTTQNAHYLGVEDRPESTSLGSTKTKCNPFTGYKRSGTYSWLNSARLGEKSSDYVLSVATHELGHFIGVRHSTESPAVMNLARDREDIYEVYEDDECAVNDRYENSHYPVTCDD